MTDARELIAVADHRERRSGVPDALESLGVSVQTATLRVGDYALDLQTRIERKTVADLHASVVSRRLWGQVNRLRSVSASSFLLVEGTDLDAGPLPPSSVRGVLIALADHGVTIIRSTDPHDSARWIRSLANARSRHKRVHVHAPFRRPIGRRDPVAVDMFCAVPGVSLASARSLVDAFGTLRRIANATPTDLREVRGVGPKRSTLIHDAFTHPL